MRKTRKGITNKESLTWKWDLLPPWFFGTNGGMGKECKLFLSSLTDKLPPPPPRTASRMPVSYLVLKQAYLLKFLRSVHTHVRGSRSPFLKDADFLDDFSVNARNADIFKISFSMFFYSSFSRQYFY